MPTASIPSRWAHAGHGVEYDNIVKGAHLALVDGGGKRLYNIGSVSVTDDATPTPVEFDEGDDYLVDAVKGTLFIPMDSAIPADSTIVVGCTPAAMTSYSIKPQTLIKGVEVYAEVWEVAESGGKQRVRVIPRGLLKSAGNAGRGVDQDNFNELVLDADLARSSARWPRGAPMPTAVTPDSTDTTPPRREQGAAICSGKDSATTRTDPRGRAIQGFEHASTHHD